MGIGEGSEGGGQHEGGGEAVQAAHVARNVAQPPAPGNRVFATPDDDGAQDGFAAPAGAGLREAPLPGLLSPDQEAEMIAALSGAERAAQAPERPRKPPAYIPDHAQHRQRLRERFMRAGVVGLHDYELLELVLFRRPFHHNAQD